MGTERRGAALLHRTHWMEPCAPVSTTRALLRAGRSVHSLLPPPWELPRAPGSQSCRLWIPQTLYPSVSPVMVTSPWPLPHLSFHRGKSLYHGHLRPLKKNTGGPQSKAPHQWPSTHKASSCTGPEDTVQPWPNASVSSQAPKKQLVLSRQP